jgi:cell division protein ZapE
MPSPLERYKKLIDTGEFRAEPAQLQAMEALNQVFLSLTGNKRPRWLPRVFQTPASHGLYLWGGVGRGKTWMMDLFHDTLPFDGKLRLHFHRFMARVHEELRARAHESEPLPDIARQWSKKYRVLCLDEFYVADIADAMLLAGLFEALFEQGVTLVTTSNIPPDELYRDGLQRARFLPAIDLIKRHTRVLEIGGDTDFRLRLLQRSAIYHFPLDGEAEKGMAGSYRRMAADCDLPPYLTLGTRRLPALQRSDGVIWFDFATLCQQARSTLDYIEVARAFHTVLLSGVTVMDDDSADTARRFVNLVDEFYDRNVILLISAEAAIDDLYEGKRLTLEFKRTRSRLTEMQSVDYLARAHLG